MQGALERSPGRWTFEDDSETTYRGQVLDYTVPNKLWPGARVPSLQENGEEMLTAQDCCEIKKKQKLTF